MGIDLGNIGQPNFTRAMTQEDCDKYLTRALDRLVHRHPHLSERLKDTDDEVVNELIAKMVVWFAECELHGLRYGQ